MKEIANFFQIDVDNYHLQVGCNVNLPGSRLQHIHYDGDYDEESFILNIPLIDTTKVNGAIKVIPESHLLKRSYLGYLLSGISKRTLQIESTQGQGLIRSSNVWHRGTPNRTDTIRPMLNIVFYKIGSSYSKDAIKNGLQYAEGRIRFRDNWYLATSLPRRLQEYAYVYFPLFHSFTRIIKSLFKAKDIL
jgi:ectoine hydroxylase-related dioxygenase (phytanoyl-CoA dioxygenase family)